MHLIPVSRIISSSGNSGKGQLRSPKELSSSLSLTMLSRTAPEHARLMYVTEKTSSKEAAKREPQLDKLRKQPETE